MEQRYGLVKTTLIDYPGEVAATIFVPGCNFRCPYCHNPELIYGRPDEAAMTLQDIVAFLNTRRTVLGGVCISGGEPLLTERVFELVEAVKQAGLKVKIDTNGSFPDRIERLLSNPGIDYIAMDIKTVPRRYHLLHPATGIPNAGCPMPGDTNARVEFVDRVRQSIGIIASSGIPHHFRTTVVPGIIGPAEMEELLGLVPEDEHLILQQFRPGKTLDPAYCDVEPYPPDRLTEMCRTAIHAGVRCRIIGVREDSANPRRPETPAGSKRIGVERKTAQNPETSGFPQSETITAGVFAASGA